MAPPKLHHYVPRFYLRRFADTEGLLWLWDKVKDRVFPSGPAIVAAENHFYFLDDLFEQGHDPLTMERQFADLEGQVYEISERWLRCLRGMQHGGSMEIGSADREFVSLFIALQFLRTAEHREILAAFAADEGYENLANKESRQLHTALLWDEPTVDAFADRICSSTWLFGRSEVTTPFITSDNPVAFRTADNRMWLKAGVLSKGTCAVFPWAPDIVMYCHPKESGFEKVAKFDRCLSPVKFSDEMVRSENSGQVFMASRFVISSRKEFEHEREFAQTIGTDFYAPKAEF